MNNIPIKELGQVVSGATPRRNIDEYWDGEIHWASLKDVSNLDTRYLDSTALRITEKGYKSCSTSLLPKGTVLVSSRAPIGHLAIASIEVCTNQGFKSIVPNKNTDSSYLYYALKHSMRALIGLGRGATFKEISKKVIEEFELPFPDSLDDQKRIAKILSDCEALIQKRKDSINLLDELLKSTFLEMFGDPRSNSKNWDSGQVIDFADCIVPGRDKPKSFSGDTPWITTNDLNHLGTTTSSLTNKGLSPSEIKTVRARVIPEDSVLMTCVGDLGVISLAGEDMVVNQQLHTFQCNEGMLPIFLMFALSFQKQYMFKMASKTTVPYMNKTTCNSIPTIKPPKELQESFISIYKQINSIKTQFNSSLEELENLYGSISQIAFKGELELDKVDISDMEDDTQEKPEMEPIGDPRWEGKVEIQDYQVHLDEIIKKDFEDSSFSFKQLEDAIADRGVYVPYDNVKEFVFKSLEGNDSLLIQEMDEKEKQIVFKIR